jgi:beta-glucosidase
MEKILVTRVFNYMCSFFILLFLQNSIAVETKPPYKNPELTVEERVNDLLSRMTLEEKFWQLFMIPGDLSDGKENYYQGIFGLQVSTKGSSGSAAEQMLHYSAGGSAKAAAEKINEIQRYFVEQTRLGIPIIVFDEALHGLVREGATSFPQSIGLAASWNTELMRDVARAIARESGSRGIRQVLSPVVNIARDVRWGRVEETYGEDPYLTSQMGVAFVSEFEKLGIITTPKHFVANVGDGGRDSYPIHFNERLLEEIYFPAFKACLSEGGSRSVMTSYNSLDGSPCTANEWLLNEKLKNKWDFKGFVISDAGATGGANVLHFTAENYAESTKKSIEAGLDVIFQTAYEHKELFFEAFEKGMIDNDRIDEAVKRVLRVKFSLGLFENPFIDPVEAEKWNGHPIHRRIAKQAALESIVLLKNENSVLPVRKDISSIAVIGEDAVEARLGGYSGPGIDKVSILRGIQNISGDSIKVNFTKGCGREAKEFSVIPSQYLSVHSDGKQISGLKGEYFNNINLQGDAVVTRIDPNIDFRWTLFSPDPEKINYDWFSARWTGILKAPRTGDFKIGIEGNDGYRLYIDDKLVIDNWRKQSYHTRLTDFYFEEDKEYKLRIEFFESTGNAWFKLIWTVGIDDQWKSDIDDAVKAAQDSDLAIVVAGIEEGEFLDRAFLNLPGHQEEMINKIAATGKPVVVVLIGGSAVTMSGWIDNVDGILTAWYPGEDGGNAVADVLFGNYNPAGRLPITFPVFEGQLPLYYNHKPTGRGDDYMNLTGEPLFPFGFGLSYTAFSYGNPEFEKTTIKAGEDIILRFPLKNIGNTNGDEVVQLYIKDEFASVARPVMELKGFQRIHLDAGEEKEISFVIKPEHLSILDKNLNRVIEPGTFRIMIGASSKDIRLREIITVTE